MLYCFQSKMKGKEHCDINIQIGSMKSEIFAVFQISPVFEVADT